MEISPLLVVELLAALAALMASSYIKLLFKSMALYRRVKHYPGEPFPWAYSGAMTAYSRPRVSSWTDAQEHSGITILNH